MTGGGELVAGTGGVDLVGEAVEAEGTGLRGNDLLLIKAVLDAAVVIGVEGDDVGVGPGVAEDEVGADASGIGGADHLQVNEGGLVRVLRVVGVGGLGEGSGEIGDVHQDGHDVGIGGLIADAAVVVDGGEGGAGFAGGQDGAGGGHGAEGEVRVGGGARTFGTVGDGQAAVGGVVLGDGGDEALHLVFGLGYFCSRLYDSKNGQEESGEDGDDGDDDEQFDEREPAREAAGTDQGFCHRFDFR